MKIAFVYGPFSTGNRYFDFFNIWNSPRGLTGSELSCLMYAIEMAKKGHDVSLFAFITHPDITIEGVKICNISQLSHRGSEGWDAACAWNEPDELRKFPSSVVRLVNQQLNDFNYCQAGYDDFVDVYTSPSDHHREYIKNHTPSPNKWEILYNGCDPTLYSHDKKIPGRMIWASSPDRGLHLLLQEWPKIKKAVPQAHLKIFYNFNFSNLDFCDKHIYKTTADLMEVAQRSRYIREALPKLKHLGVEHVGSISRLQMIEEMNQAEVLPYPCDTVSYTEGFSVTTMEACAAKALPVLGAVDALPSIYNQGVVLVPSPVYKHAAQFSDETIKALNDEQYRSERAEQAYQLSLKFAWTDLANTLEKILIQQKGKK